MKAESNDFSLDEKKVKTEPAVVVSVKTESSFFVTNGHLAEEEVKPFSDQVCNTFVDQAADSQQELKLKPAFSNNTEADMVCIVSSKKLFMA
jgi:hypothetical protein